MTTRLLTCLTSPNRQVNPCANAPKWPFETWWSRCRRTGRYGTCAQRWSTSLRETLALHLTMFPTRLTRESNAHLSRSHYALEKAARPCREASGPSVRRRGLRPRNHTTHRFRFYSGTTLETPLCGASACVFTAGGARVRRSLSTRHLKREGYVTASLPRCCYPFTF